MLIFLPQFWILFNQFNDSSDLLLRVCCQVAISVESTACGPDPKQEAPHRIQKERQTASENENRAGCAKRKKRESAEPRKRNWDLSVILYFWNPPFCDDIKLEIKIFIYCLDVYC